MQMSPKWQQNGLKTATKWELRHCPEKQGDPERHPGVSKEIPVNPQGAHRNSRGSPEGGTRRDQELAKGSLHASTRNSRPRQGPAKPAKTALPLQREHVRHLCRRGATRSQNGIHWHPKTDRKQMQKNIRDRQGRQAQERREFTGLEGLTRAPREYSASQTRHRAWN